MATGLIRSLWNRARKNPKHIVLPEGDDSRTAQAARILLDEGIVSAVTVLGKKEAVEAAFAKAQVDNAGVVGVDPEFSPDRERYATHLFERRKAKGMTMEQAMETLKDELYFGAGMVALGDADGDVAGAAHTTGDVIRAALHMIGTSPGIRTVSGAFLMEVPNYLGSSEPRCFLYADCGVVPNPTAPQLADIAVASAASCKALLGLEPKVAMLSFSTKGSAEHEDVSKVREATALAKEKLGDAVDGELQADAAIIPSIADRKCPGSSVAGTANVLVFPDLDSGNIAYKLTQRMAQAEAIGPLLQGLAKPAHDLSRGSDAEDIATVAAIAVLQANS